MTALSLAAIAALVLINGFFVAAEFALVSSRPERLTDRSGAGARIAQRQVAQLDQYLSACQLGITIASLALGALGEPTIAGLLEPLLESTPLAHIAAGTILALLIMTALHITVGEQAPKSFAIGTPERVAAFCALPLEGFHRALRPLVQVLNAASNSLVRLFGGTPATGHGGSATLEELRVLIGAATQSGDIDRTDSRMLRGAFTLDERRASDVMTPRGRLITTHVGETIEVALRRGLAEGRSRLPLLDARDEGLVGVVYTRELAAALLDGHAQDDVETVGNEILIAPETLRLDRLLTRFQHERQSVCAVLDEYGSLVGLVSVEDIVEEVVGEIEDESDRPAALRVLGNGAIICSGDTPLVDLEAYAITVDEDVQSESIGGYVTERLGRFARVDDEVDLDGRTVRVRSLDGRAIRRVIVLPRPARRATDIEGHQETGDSEDDG